MTTDMPSSEEMIRSAKEALGLATEDFLPSVDDALSAQGVSVGGLDSSMSGDTPAEKQIRAPAQPGKPSQGVAQPLRTRRVAVSSQEHLVVAPRGVRTVSVPVPPASFPSGSMTGSGLWMRVVGNILLAFVVATWVLLLLGVIDNPDDLGETIGGGAVMTLVPFLFGLILRRAGKRRGIAA